MEGVLIIKMFPTSFRPEIVQDEASQDVEGLAGVGEASGVVREEVGGVVFELRGDLSQKDERPGRHEVSMSFPLDPYAFVSFPGDLSSGVVEEVVSRGLFGARVTHFAFRG